MLAADPLETESVPVLPLLMFKLPPAEAFALLHVTPAPRLQTAVDPTASISPRVEVSPGRLVAMQSTREGGRQRRVAGEGGVDGVEQIDHGGLGVREKTDHHGGTEKRRKGSGEVIADARDAIKPVLFINPSRLSAFAAASIARKAKATAKTQRRKENRKVLD